MRCRKAVESKTKRKGIHLESGSHSVCLRSVFVTQTPKNNVCVNIVMFEYIHVIHCWFLLTVKFTVRPSE